MVLPPIESIPSLVLQFARDVSPRLIDLVDARFRQEGLTLCSRKVHHENGTTLLRLTTTQKQLERMAERIHLMKLTADTRTIEYFTVQDRLRFCDSRKSRWEGPNGMHVCTENTATLNRDEYGLFTSNEWALLIRRILDEVTVLPDGVAATELSHILDETYHAEYHVRQYVPSGGGGDGGMHTSSLRSDESSSRRIGPFWDLTTSFTATFRQHGAQSVCLRHVLETYGIVQLVSLSHFPQIRSHILYHTCFPWTQLEPPVQEIQDYYGWEISFYFAWMGFLTKWLLFPGILGVLLFLWRLYRHDSIEEDEYTPLYGLVTFLWGVLFLKFWERHEHRLAFRWGTLSMSLYERQKYFATRPQFRGYLRRSPVTGRPETYYPASRRRLKYIVSALATTWMLAIAFGVMVLSLNLQGYIHPNTNPARWNDDSDPHPFHVRSLAVLSEEGRLFDATSQWRRMLPVILHATGIFTLNSIYRVVAEFLTNWENHETGLDHRNSLILKRFLFEAFDCYVALFYLAFYERDTDRLRIELMTVFQLDTVRRVLLECILPILLQRLAHGRSSSASVGSVRLRPSSLTIAPTNDTLLDDLDKDEYDQFDDYMEIVIQLGYVTLFASAYPLASLISIAANWVEIRTDCFKLTTVCRRPFTFRSSGLGMWKTLMSCVIWMSAITNCLIAGFTSGQLAHFLPDFYARDESGDMHIQSHEGWTVVFVIFGLERVLLFAGLLIYAIVPSVPEDVSNQIERRQFIHWQKREANTKSNSNIKQD